MGHNFILTYLKKAQFIGWAEIETSGYLVLEEPSSNTNCVVCGDVLNFCRYRLVFRAGL